MLKPVFVSVHAFPQFADNPDRGEYVIHLTSGSLLLMMGATQDDWQVGL